MNVQKITALYSHNQLKLSRRNTEYSHFKPTSISQYQGLLEGGCEGVHYTEMVQGRIHGRDFVSMFYKFILRFREEYFVIKNGKI